MATTKKTTSAAKTKAKASKATAAKTAPKSTKTAPAKKAAITTTKSGKKSTSTKATETKKTTAKAASKKEAVTKKSATVAKTEKVKTEKVKATKAKTIKEKSVKEKTTKEKATPKTASAKEKATPVKAKAAASKTEKKEKAVAKKSVKTEVEPKKKAAAPVTKTAKVSPKAEKPAPAKVAKPAAEAPTEEKETRKTGFVHRRKRKSDESGPKEVVIARRTLDDSRKNSKEGEHSKMMASFHPKRRSLLESADENKEPVYRYSDEDLKEFKNIILQRLDKARQELAYLQGVITRKSEAGTDDTDNRYNHLEDSPTLEREKLSQLASRQVQFIRHLENALIRIENKTYGICRVTGKLISKERLRVVPHATLSIEAKKMRK